MIRILFYLVLLAAAAYGADWLLQRPGHFEVTWGGYHVATSAAFGFVAIVLAAIVLMLVWSLLRLIFGLPSFMILASRQRRREKGYAALSRGLIAAGAGDAQGASRASAQASKHLKDDPLALFLRAQAAGLSGDSSRAEAAYGELAQREETRVLGLRGLHDQATRRGDDEAAHHFAAEAHNTAPSPWSAQSVLEQHAANGDWEKALQTVETSVQAKLVDQATGERQRAILETAIGLDKEAVAPDAALALARSAIRRAPDLVPAVVLAARLHTRRGDIRKAVKVIETAWPRCPHPELARAYLDVRPGDSTSDRLARAQTLLRISSFDPTSRMTVARSALAAKDFAAARAAMAPLVTEGQRPSVRTCLVMADLEDAEFGDLGQWREWLARASRAPLDPAWIADGIVYEQWSPVSPTTGRLDAFVWQAPADRLGPAMEALPARSERRPSLVGAPATELAPSSLPTSSLPAPSPAPTVLPPSPAPTVLPPPAPAPPAIAFRETPSPAPALVFDGGGPDAAKLPGSPAPAAAPDPAPAAVAAPAPVPDSAAEVAAILTGPKIEPPPPPPEPPRRPFMRSVRPPPVVAPASPGPAPQHEDLTTTG